jgi:hypothetical protein
MARNPVFADIPKFKQIERSMRLIVVDHRKLLQRIASSNADAYERECLDSAADECRQAAQHMNEAISEVYRAVTRRR